VRGIGRKTSHCSCTPLCHSVSWVADRLSGRPEATTGVEPELGSPAPLFACPTVWDWQSHRRVFLLRGINDDEIGGLPREGWCLPSIARPELDRRRFVCCSAVGGGAPVPAERYRQVSCLALEGVESPQGPATDDNAHGLFLRHAECSIGRSHSKCNCCHFGRAIL